MYFKFQFTAVQHPYCVYVKLQIVPQKIIEIS